MTDSPLSNQSSSRPLTSNIDEIDLNQVLGVLLRHKFFISKITLLLTLIAGIYAFTRKPVWEGQFQIVLENQNSGSTSFSQYSANNSLPALLAGIGGAGPSELETEVKILESPSVLKSTFDFVKSQKIKKGQNVSNWSFRSWRDSNLDIELVEGTSVLNITYRDTEKNLILPVINRISNAYQSYSGRDRSKSIRNGLEFVQKQVDTFSKRSKNPGVL